jgi:tetratricopeptide (TPR) repeat protein
MFRRAAALSPDYCFPNRLEDVLILEEAIHANPEDSFAPYYLGNFWYAHRRYEEAIACWERSSELNPTIPTAHRNLGLAYYNKRHEPEKALEHFETAFRLNPDDARVFFELDQLYKQVNRNPAWRLALLENYPGLVGKRDDLSVEYISLLNLSGRHEDAYLRLMQRNFHPWEGGEGKVTGQYVISLMEIARDALDNGQPQAAIEALEKALGFPHNLGEGKLYGAQENNIFYYLGCAFEQLGDIEESTVWFERASTGLSEPTSAIYYNDQPPDMIFYQGLANLKLHRKEAAEAIFNKLVEFGVAHLDDNVEVDYFAVSLPDFLVFDVDMNERNRIHCLYMMALGELGRGDSAAALEHFDSILALDASHMGATLHRRLIE